MDNTFTSNLWQLGGKLVELIEKGRAVVATIERSDGSQFKRYLYDEVAKKASALGIGSLVALKGSMYKPEDSRGLRYAVREIDEVDEVGANINLLEVEGVISEEGELTATDGTGRPKYPVVILCGTSRFVFNAYDEVAKTASTLEVGQKVCLRITFFATLADEDSPEAGWKTRFSVKQIDPVEEPKEEKAKGRGRSTRSGK